MKLCKDCEIFHNGCAFSEIAHIYDECAYYAACAQFVPKKETSLLEQE